MTSSLLLLVFWLCAQVVYIRYPFPLLLCFFAPDLPFLPPWSCFVRSYLLASRVAAIYLIDMCCLLPYVYFVQL